MEFEVTFPGGLKTATKVGDFTILSDQEGKRGGQGAAPPPFVQFLASIASCAGIYVLEFCRVREIPTAGLRLIQSVAFDEKNPAATMIRIEIRLPPGFPAKYEKAVARVAHSCSVEKQILNPPQFEVEVRPAVESPG